MSKNHIITASMADQAAAVRAGAVTAEGLVAAHLARAEARQPTLNGFRVLDHEGALAAARALDATLQREPARLASARLLGVPIAVKDQIATAGLVTSAGSRMLADWVPPYDATVVARLRAEGAIILGKTNQDEFGMGSTSATCAFGPVSNPWDPTRVAGGSSGGSAAVVADLQAAAALGTDTGGSIRQPAAFCGLVGLKPTWGLVSRAGAIAYASSLDQIGPIARTTLDAALLLDVMAGPDPADMGTLADGFPASATPQRTTRHADAVASRSDLRGLRVGVPRELLGLGNAAEVLAVFEAALGRLEALGAALVPVSLPHVRHAVEAYYLVATAEAASNLARYDGVRYGHRAKTDVSSVITGSAARDFDALVAASRAEGFGAEVKRRILLGTFALSAGYQEAFYGRAQQVRTRIAEDLAAAFADVDVLASPTSPVGPFRHGEGTDDPLALYLTDIDTVVANLAGVPAISLPAGLDASGLPVGLQLMAPRLGETTLLSVAGCVERYHPFPVCPTSSGVTP
jgi:aspartyl-tRNA(Asn)/glutamyl-tRNA(Gln) amidotransferase subunit A